MLLQTPAPVEPRCPRRWSLTVAGGLLTLAVLVAGVGFGAHAAPAPPRKDTPSTKDLKKEEPKKGDDKKKEADKKNEAEGGDLELFPIPPGMDANMVRQMREQMRLHRKEMERMMQQMRQFTPGGWAARDHSHQVRLGARVEAPSATLADQLDLPKGQGLVLEEVMPDTAAAKAGLKAHDILLELNGKPVPDQVEGLAKLLADIKADKPVDAVVLRKGKRETIKGLSLPEAKPARPELPGFFPPNFPNVPAIPNIGVGGFGGMFLPAAGGQGVMTTTFRHDDRFTTRHQEGSLIITLTGKVADGKAKVSDIHVQDGQQTHQYESVDKVPEQYRDKVKNLVEMSEKGSVRIEIKTP